MKIWQIADDRIQATLTEENDSLWVTIDDLVNGKRWPKSPLLVMHIHDKAVRRDMAVAQYRIDLVESASDRLHVVIGHAASKVDMGLWLRVQGGELSVVLSPAEVYERDSRMFRFFSIDIMPGMMQSGPNGTLLLPLNTGALCSPRDKQEMSDKFLIYGEQPRWELMPSLPVCGTQDIDGGLTALACSGAEDTECIVSTDGKGSGQVGFGFSLRRLWPDPVDMNRREIRYVPVPPDADLTVFTAKRLRRHLMEDMGKPTISQRAEESPEVAYTLGAYTMKLFHGVENVGYMMEGRDKSGTVSFVNCMTFSEGAQCLSRLHEAGIDKVYTQSVGWNARGHDGLYPTRFPVEERLGGEEGFRAMIDLGNSFGYMMSVHDNFLASCEDSPEHNTDLLTCDMFGEPMIRGFWAGGIDFGHWPPALDDDYVLGHMRKLKSIGIRGVYYMDGMGNPLEVNYDARRKGSRRDCAQGVTRLLDHARTVFGASACENGFLYCTTPSDYIAQRPNEFQLVVADKSWPVIKMIDKVVPIWQLALHDLVITENNAAPTWSSAMRGILFGDHPRDEWSVRPYVMPMLDDTRIRALKDMYDLVLGKYGYLQSLELTNYTEPTDGVQQTRFADGTCVTLDSTKNELFVNDQPVQRPDGLLKSPV